MKYTWYMFRVDEPISYCYDCPCYDGEYGDCRITGRQMKGNFNPEDNGCPLIKIEGRVEE